MSHARKHISLTTKLASALCSIVREVDGKLVPVIPRDKAKHLTAGEIITMFEWNHIVHHAIGGSDHPSNIEPLLAHEHRAITAARDIPQIAKTKRIAKRHRAHETAVGAKISDAPVVAKTARSGHNHSWRSRPFATSRAGTWKKKMDGSVERR